MTPTLPRLAVLHHYGSGSPAEVAQQAAGLADLVFAVDPADPASGASRAALAAAGDVVELSDAHKEAPGREAGRAPTPPADLAQLLGGPALAGVATFADRWVPLAGAVAAELALPGNSADACRLATTKFDQRQRLNEAGIGTTPTTRLTFADGILTAPPRFPYPAIVKPDHGGSSADTVRVEGAAGFEAAVADLDPHRGYVMEALLPAGRHPRARWLADYASVEAAVVDGHFTTLGITDRTPVAEPFRETGMVSPTALDAGTARQVVTVAEAATAALGVTDGLVHVEVKLCPSGPAPIEVNARLGGDIHRLLTRTGVCRPLRVALELALGRTDSLEVRPARGVAGNFSVQPPVGATAVAALPDPSSLRALPGVFGVQRLIPPGGPVDWRTGSIGRVLDIWIEAEDHDQLADRRADVDELVAQAVTWHAAHGEAAIMAG